MPTFKLKSDGREYTTDNPIEVTRLRASRQYEEVGVEVHTVADTRFHPVDHTVAEVKAYLDEHPEDAGRVIAEEKGGQARSSLLGD